MRDACHTPSSTSRFRSGFTIVEMLVVIGVTALLIGIVMPAFSAARKTCRSMVSQSNLRQWGVGTANYAALNKDMLPWEGFKGAPEMHLNFAEPTWWANAVPPFVGGKPYRQMSDEATAAGRNVPVPGSVDDSGSIFIDPSAATPDVAPHIGGPAGAPKQFFFCYVPNLQLNATAEAESAGLDAHPRMRLGSISNASATVLMLEMRTVKSELRADDPYYNFTLVRARSDWKRLAARHRGGGHVLMADGHVQRVDFNYATTNRFGTRDPNHPNADWNHTDLIWNPRGPAVEGPGS